MSVNNINIAAGCVCVTMVLFLGAFIANGYGQLKTTGLYVPPTDLVDMIKLVLSVGTACLTLGSVQNKRKQLEKKEQNDDACNK